MEVVYVHGHYEAWLNGEFVATADSWSEAMAELYSILKV